MHDTSPPLDESGFVHYTRPRILMNTASRLCPPTPRTLLHVALLVVPLSALVIGCKIYKIMMATDTLGVGTLATALAPDVAFLLLYAVFWVVLLHCSRGRLWLATSVLFSLSSFVLLFLALVEQAFYLSTGTHLDGYILIHAAENLPMVHAVIASEMGVATWAAIALLLIIALAPWMLHRRAKARPSTSQQRTP